MRAFEFVIAIIAIVLTYRVFMTIFRDRAQRDDPQADQQLDAERRVADLEERIKVLERIITDKDKRADLRREFSDLE